MKNTFLTFNNFNTAAGSTTIFLDVVVVAKSGIMFDQLLAVQYQLFSPNANVFQKAFKVSIVTGTYKIN